MNRARLLAGGANQELIVSSAVAAGALAVAASVVIVGLPAAHVAPAVAAIAVAIAARRSLLAWPNVLAGAVLIILLIPIRRYTMPGNLPFELEPYRVAVALIATMWFLSLLVDRRVRFRKSVVDRPLVLLAGVAVASVIVNGGRVASVSDIVAKKLTFFASFFVLFYVIVSLVRQREDVLRLVRVLVGGATVVAFFALIESRTGMNVFNGLARVVPILELGEVLAPEDISRGGRQRVYASAQHPIALGALMVMLIPLSIALARIERRARWWGATVLLTLAALATLSRTGVLMLVVAGLVLLRLRPVEVRRFWPAIIPILIAVHIALPGAIGTIKASFFPSGGLVAEQRQLAGERGSGRVADLEPGLREASQRPILGQGYGTRVVDVGRANAFILDNQWLAWLLETGIVGAAALLWLFGRAFRRLSAAARRDSSDEGWLFAALAASILSFAVGMFTYDAFSFIQVTVIFFVLLGLSASALALGDRERLRVAFARTSARH